MKPNPKSLSNRLCKLESKLQKLLEEVEKLANDAYVMELANEGRRLEDTF